MRSSMRTTTTTTTTTTTARAATRKKRDIKRDGEGERISATGAPWRQLWWWRPPKWATNEPKSADGRRPLGRRPGHRVSPDGAGRHRATGRVTGATFFALQQQQQQQQQQQKNGRKLDKTQENPVKTWFIGRKLGETHRNPIKPSVTEENSVKPSKTR